MADYFTGVSAGRNAVNPPEADSKGNSGFRAA
jgi:hypothetical protein